MKENCFVPIVTVDMMAEDPLAALYGQMCAIRQAMDAIALNREIGGISAQRGGEGRLLTKLSPLHIFEEAKHNKKARFRGQNRQKTATPFKI